MSYSSYDALSSLLDTGVLTGYFSFISIFYALVIIGRWKLYEKAGKPGWATLIPFYAEYCLFDITFGSGWMFLLTFIPCVNVIMMIILEVKLAKSFGQSTAFALGLIFLPPIFYLILGFGDSKYIGPQ